MSQNYECVTNFAHAFVGATNNRNLCNCSVIHEFVFNFSGVRVEATHDEHVFEAIGDGDVAMLIHDPDISCM